MIEIDNKKDCCGCTACYSVCPKKCITMKEDFEGFKYPEVNKEQCIDCDLCKNVCPILKDKPKDNLTEAFIVRTLDNEVLSESSSGGAFTALSDTAINNSATVFGGAFDKDFNVIHASAKTKEDAKKFRGSKYVQSNLSDTFLNIKELLNKGEKVLFSGTPCQVSGLVSFLGKPYDNLITVDFVCHAVPSPKVWEKYREFLYSKYNSKIKNVNFRSKVYGYHCSSMKVELENGKVLKNGLSTDLMLKSFFKDVACRPSCYDCQFKTVDRNADITIFDCWNITRYAPNKKDDNRGYSAVIVHNQKAKDFFEKAKPLLECYDADLDLLMKIDGKMGLSSIKYTPKREEFFKLLDKGLPLDEVVDKVIPIKTSKKIAGKAKGFLYKTHMLGILQKIKK